MKKLLGVLLFSLLIPSVSHAADLSCLSIPANDDMLTNTGSFNKKEYREELIGQQENPATDLMGCAASVLDGKSAASSVKGNCGCKKAIASLCSFNIKKHRIKASGGASVAWCAPFAPWNL
ncbi:hypothetical protein [Pseudomonas sp. S1(2024)]|uniref:hypothetical protein n=1 Tax=Pseudomonas sp. S1(2024) TaxID=3390191 RepID=UPI003978FE83